MVIKDEKKRGDRYNFPTPHWYSYESDMEVIYISHIVINCRFIMGD